MYLNNTLMLNSRKPEFTTLANSREKSEMEEKNWIQIKKNALKHIRPERTFGLGHLPVNCSISFHWIFYLQDKRANQGW